MAKKLYVRNNENTEWVEVASSIQDISNYLTINSASLTYATKEELNNIDLSSASAAAVAAIVDSAPATLDTLNELAAALNDDENFAGTVTTSLSNKLNSSEAYSTFLTSASMQTTPVYVMNSGGSAQRPVSASVGMFRFNTDIGEPEWYSAATNSWVTFSVGVRDGSSSERAITSGTALYNMGIRQSGIYWLNAHGRRSPFQAYVALDDTWKGSVLVIKQAGRTLTSSSSAVGNGDITSLATTLGEINAGEGTKFDDTVIQDLANRTTATVGLLSYRDAKFTNTTASNNSTGSFRLSDAACWLSWDFSSFNYANRMNPGTVYTNVDLGGAYSIAGSSDGSHNGWNTYVGDAAYSFITNHASGYGFQNHTMNYSSDDAVAIFVRSSV